MKLFKFTLILFLTISALTFFSSCGKYPDGPDISLRSRNERISNVWKVDNYNINGSDFTSLVTGYSETFTNSGSYSYNWGKLDGAGSWMLQNSDKEIKLNGNDDHSSRTLFILKLEEKSFWYYYMDGNDKHELHLIPN